MILKKEDMRSKTKVEDKKGEVRLEEDKTEDARRKVVEIPRIQLVNQEIPWQDNEVIRRAIEVIGSIAIAITLFLRSY